MLQRALTVSGGGGGTTTLETTNLPRNTQFSDTITNGVVVLSPTGDDSNIFYISYFVEGVETQQYRHSNVTESYSSGTLTLTCSYSTAMNVRVFKCG